MTDDANAAASDVAQPSQVLNDTATHENPSKGALPQGEPPKEQAKPLSTRDAIAKAFDDQDAKAKEGEKPADDKGKVEDKAKAEPVKDEAKDAKQDKGDKSRSDDGKLAKSEQNTAEQKADQSAADKPATERAGQADDRQSEGRKHTEPPARFLPEARTKWANVPNEVKAEIHRVSAEYETQIERSRPAVEAYESVKEYDEMAKAAGTTMKDAMRNYVEIDKLLLSNPAQGFARIMQSIGITPQQLVQEITKNPQAFQLAPQQPSPQPQQQASPEVQRLQQENQTLRQEAIRNAAVPIIEAFAAEHPDYHEKEAQIMGILKSGVINELYGDGLTPAQRLAEAYRMAGGNAPSQSAPQALPDHSEPSPARPVDPDGQKSVRGAPSAGQTSQKRPQFKSNREALERAFADAGHR